MKKQVLLTALLLATALPSTVYAGQWFKDNGSWAYQQDNGTQIKEGWFTDTDGRVYNFNGGVVRSGFYKENNVWYYFDPTSGERRSGWVDDNGKRYFLDRGGVMQTGWVQVNGLWYYAKGDGAIIQGKLSEINGSKYYFHSDGHMAVNEWVDDETYHAGTTGAIDTGVWIDDSTYVNSTGKRTDEETKSSTKKEKIDNKVFTLEEYKEMAEDAYGRYYDHTDELFGYINDYREEYNETRVWNYSGDDDNYIDEHELPSFDRDSVLDKAATLRAVELASQQRASGARPDGRNMNTVLTDYGITSITVTESVAFGQDDAEDCFSDLKSGNMHSAYWQKRQYTQCGIGLAYDVDGKPYWVIMYVEP